MCLIAAPKGIAKITKDHPDVHIYFASLYEKLNENGYIVPSLGDARDRIFGTKLQKFYHFCHPECSRKILNQLKKFHQVVEFF